MAGASVLAGTSGLDRDVRGVNIVEVPDVWQWLEGGELLLSAGYVWQNDPEGLLDLVSKLELARVSAIAFKLGRYLDSLPPEFLAEADEVGLPVIRLPADVAYREVFESLYGNLNSGTTQLDVSREARQTLAHFSLDEQSIEKVVGSLARQLGVEAFVVDLLDEEVVSAAADGGVQRVGFTGMGERTGEVVRELKAQKLHRAPSKFRFHQSEGIGSALVVSHRIQGYIAVYGTGPFEDEAAGTLAHAGELVSFLLLKRMALLEGRRQAGGLYLQSLLSDTLTNEEAAERGLTLGLRLTKPTAVFLASFCGRGSARTGYLDDIIATLDRFLGRNPHVVTPGTSPGTVLGLVQVGSDEGVFDRLEEFARDMSPGEAIIGCGSPGIGVEGVRRSRGEAFIAQGAGERLQRRGLVFFKDLGVERLLSQIPPGPTATGYVSSLLGPFKDEPDLLRTVELYLQNGCNKVATAAAIPLHRSSLIYRLEKAEKLLGMDLSSSEHRLELWLAIRLQRMIEAPDG